MRPGCCSPRCRGAPGRGLAARRSGSSATQRDKVPVGPAPRLTPGQGRLGLSYRTLANCYFNNERVAAWLADLLDEWDGPAIVIWDGGNMQKDDPIEAVVQGARAAAVST